MMSKPFLVIVLIFVVYFFGSDFFLGQNDLGGKKIWAGIFSGKKNLGRKFVWVKKNIDQKFCWVKKNRVGSFFG